MPKYYLRTASEVSRVSSLSRYTSEIAVSHYIRPTPDGLWGLSGYEDSLLE